MKRLIIAQIKIELDSEKSEYSHANIGINWRYIVSDILGIDYWKVDDYCSIQIDETKDKNEND